jgi:RNA-binding protein PNO1
MSSEAVEPSTSTMMEIDNQENTQATSFPQIKVVESDDPQYRKVMIPSHRLTPLKSAWMKIYTPLVENLKLQVRFNPKARAVEMRSSRHTVETGALQKAADFVRAFSLGFDVEVLCKVPFYSLNISL